MEGGLNMLMIEDLQVKIGEREVLRHIDLEIKRGETHILFGPNGSGKTTLLMTIMGYPQLAIRSWWKRYTSKRLRSLFVNISFPSSLIRIMSSSLTTPADSSSMCISRAMT
jgi:ABC-type molybdenum transport system ATPase subunit/photorepair protein PhrA